MAKENTKKRRFVPDSELKEMIEAGKSAKQICDENLMSIWTLQGRWAMLQAKAPEKLSVPSGLFSGSDEIEVSKMGLIVPRRKVTDEFGFEKGSKFQVSFDSKSKKITLAAMK